jgi:hypothetical protein
MRTTLTLDADVAVQLKRLLKARDGRLKDVINEALRRGLIDMERPSKPRKPFRTPTMDLGRPLMENMDNIAEVLAIAEGEDYK